MSISLDVNLNIPETPKGVPESLFSEFRHIYSALRNLASYLNSIAGGVVAATPIRGTVTLVAGTKSVVAPAVVAGTLVFLTVQALGTVAAPKAVHVIVTAGVGFVITSADATDTSVVAWMYYPS